MTHTQMSRLNPKAIAALPAAAVEPTALALATEIDRLEALLVQLQRRLIEIPTHSRPDKENIHALS